jgi:hypothetical protein
MRLIGLSQTSSIAALSGVLDYLQSDLFDLVVHQDNSN